MKKYQVIIFLDEVKEKSYYHSYVISDDITLGNIECDELPPYADIQMAQSCYWDTETQTWVFDEDKYSEILAKAEELKAEQEEKEKEAEITPSNYELLLAINDLAETVDLLMEKVGGAE